MADNYFAIVQADGTETVVEKVDGLLVDFQGRNSSLRIGQGSVFHGCRFTFGSNAHVTIGTTHRRGLRNVVVNMTGRGESRTLRIGAGTSIEGCRFALAGDGPRAVTIGEDCMMSSGVTFRPSDGHAIFDLDTGEVVNHAAPIVVGDHVWIAADVTFVKGSVVADNTVVGTRSLVTREFPEENTVIAGAPAKVVRQRVGWDRKHVEEFVPQSTPVTNHRERAFVRSAASEASMIFNRKKNKRQFAQNEPSKSESHGLTAKDYESELLGHLRPRIGISGSLARGNYGDELYVRVYEQWLGQWADLTLLTGIYRPTYFRSVRNNQVDLMDAVVIGGGDLLCPYRPRIDQDFINPMYLRRPVHVAGIGVERNRPDIDTDVLAKWTKFLTNPNMKSISTRDPGSAKWITDHVEPRVPVSTHPDLVCALSLPEAKRPVGAPILGIVTRHIKSPKEYRLLAEIAEAMIAKGWRVRHIIGGIGAHGEKDLENANELRVEGKETFHSESLDAISRALGECTLVLSMKLHTTLVATMYGVPTICVNPVVKARAFMESIGRGDLAVSPTDRRLVKIIEDGVPEVPMDAVDRLREEAIGFLKSLSHRIWTDYRNESPVRQHLLEEEIAWA